MTHRSSLQTLRHVGKVAVRSRAARWGLAISSACVAGYVVQAAVESSLEASLFAAGTAMGHALLVAPTNSDVDWEALEREVAATEPSNECPNEQTATPSGSASDTRDKARGAAKDHGSKPHPNKGTKGIFVSADQVVRLSKSAKVPASRFVEAKGERPAGLQVAGVSGLGIGVRDGDVLTRVAGTDVKSSATVISTVLQLRAKRASVISGEFWRGEERFQIAFQMPYLPTEPAPSGSLASPTTPHGGPRAPAGSSVASN